AASTVGEVESSMSRRDPSAPTVVPIWVSASSAPIRPALPMKSLIDARMKDEPVLAGKTVPMRMAGGTLVWARAGTARPAVASAVAPARKLRRLIMVIVAAPGWKAKDGAEGAWERCTRPERRRYRPSA